MPASIKKKLKFLLNKLQFIDKKLSQNYKNPGLVLKNVQYGLKIIYLLQYSS